MSDPKNAAHGATWIRRSLVATAATAMAFTSLLAGPASAAPKAEDTTISTTITVDGSKTFGNKGPTIVVSAMRGGSWS